ncbi:MBL fold metallo-hydrolase [Dyella sp. Tek66A03]|uniref:MBL fold metallo-hydrolase n=1 Tax=Dyella sp. Tek66A03 TaxID=3458298 RepID=UPI00403EED5C
MKSSGVLMRASLAMAVILGLGAVAAPVQQVQAAAAQVRKSDAAYYRFMLGKFEVTALFDGTTPLPVDQLLTQTTPEQVKKVLAANYISSPYEMNFNAFLINTGDKLVLIDTGAGALFGPNLGKMIDALKASGYTPAQVDEIYITHMHPDHVGGLVADGKAVFPNAIVRADKREGDFWLSQANLDKAGKDEKGFFQGAQAALKPYVDSGRYKPFDGATELVPGIKSMPLPGHTPGHAGYLVESEGQKLLAWGDVIHVGAVQFAQPSVTIRFDADSKSAEAARLKLMADAAKQGYWIAGAHLSFPGVGHIRANGNNSYTWIPANYSAIH